ncbi:hypothetical protein V499_06919 [Pseudogymnoascus sp. VKM F-103]|uniref:Uncharacterized protein n=1 Tax=Pseudogymnoascus verrucosus TaxID=342668 RepID=A0A1B8GUJ4_9PEZI|nr:uncharacterized protein VE01_02809 [Pseudogymnoascus verrucosus]KFY72969.1 hypothetical protein V499_06919 [Pseudogymnoascus sp. VKM F-103]OBT99512.1 hypothetical protein VE01_02809 [Pseudogymnoascus verrucosus]
MSYYDNQQWPATAAGQATWEHQTPPARSGASSVAPREDSTAFSSQLEEVDRAIENLFKSGKAFSAPARRDSAPIGAPARSFPEQYSGPPRHNSVSGGAGGNDFSGDARSFSASNLQSFYATQRHQPARGASEAEQVLQAKRRMAAQRERELRNYHQEQQYNRTALAELSAFGTKPDRALSPSTMSDDSRRDLIARQRSALYGDSTFPEGSFVDENGVTRQATPAQPGRGHSPLAFEAPAPKDAAAGAVGTPAEERSSPFENRGASGSPAANSPPNAKGQSGSVAPIGTRPAATTANSSNSTATTGTTTPTTSSTAAPNQATAQKGRTTPLPSPLSYGFGAPAAQEKGEDAKEGASNAQGGNGNGNGNGGMGWGKGAGGGVWGKGSLGVQASVWG